MQGTAKLKEQLRAGGGKRDIAKFIENDELVAQCGVEKLGQANNSGFTGATTSGWQTNTDASYNNLTSCTATYYRVHSRDQFGQTSAWSNTVSTIVDSVPPNGDVTIDGGAVWTNVGQVSLSLTASDDCATTRQLQMRLQNDGEAWSAWQPYASTKAWNLASGDGAKTVTLQVRDGAGNESGTVNATITLDSTDPVVTKPTLSHASFSPNGDGSQDTVTIDAAITEANPVDWTIQIQDGSGAVVWFCQSKRATFDHRKGQRFVWDARKVIIEKGNV